VRFRGAAYRAHHPKWSWSPLSGEGAKINGGRFNRKGTAALYLSLDFATAVVEASQGFPFRIPPLTIVTYDVDCEDIADLTTAKQQKTHGARPGDLACAWKILAETGAPVPSWALADKLIEEGFAGIIVPSFAPGAGRAARNLVLWRWGDALPHKVTIFDPGKRLPRDGSSWPK
jgi:RES domain-containing protein